MMEATTWIPLRDAWEAVTRKADSPRFQEKALQDALRRREINSVANYIKSGDDPSLGEIAVNAGLKIEKAFWDFAVIDWQQSAGLRVEMSMQDESGANVTLPRLEIVGIYVSREDLLNRWHIPDYFELTSSQPILAPRGPRRKGPGGRGGDFDWEKCLIEAARWMHLEGIPSKQSHLIRHMAEWFGEDAPSDTQLKEHLGPLYLALKTGESSD